MPLSLSIRTLTKADLEAADVVVREAYNVPSNAPGGKARLQRYLTLQPDGWFLAVLDGKFVGLVGAIDYGPFAYIGLMSVSPSVQRRGIGRVLMTHLIAWLDGRACPSALLDATPVGAPLYELFAFIEDDKTAQWHNISLHSHEREALAARAAFVNAYGSYNIDASFMLPEPLYSPVARQLSLQQSAEIPDLAAFDKQYFGASRANVFASLLSDYPQAAFVVRDENGHISGYLFKQARTIGPWVASTPEDAETLLRHVLALPFFGAYSVNVSVANQHASRLLSHYGFRQQRVLSHMRRGHAPLRDRTKLYAQTSFALG